MITSRAGSEMASEIGIMRISEQIDTLVTMHINPIRFVFSPRIVAAIISFPLLTALFDVVGILGGFISGSVIIGINRGIYMDKVVSSIHLADITMGL
jgi:phospholipid/cholesterol/gamma-HCH transport system permease protein